MGLPRFPRACDESVLPEEGQLFYCDSCEMDVTYEFKVRCAECNDYDLCVNCFLSGKETKQHKSNHSYIPVSRNEQCLFSDGWTADEELLLLDTVAKVGLGNWPEVADNVAIVGTKPAKSKTECEEHLYKYHVGNTAITASFHWPANPNRLALEEARRRAHEALVGKYLPTPRPPYYPPPAGFHCTIAGFMPLRNDFEHEWENDYELQLAEVELRGDEAPQEKELKLIIVLTYCAVLDGRYERKKMIIERGYADMRRLANYETSIATGPVSRQLIQLFRSLGRYDFPTSAHLDSYVHHPLLLKLARLLLDEHMLCERMEVIREWKALGLLYWDEVVNYESFRAAGTRAPRRGDGSSSMTTDYGSSCLSPQETQLCQKTLIPPLQYLVTKAITLKVLASSNDANTGGGTGLIAPPPSGSNMVDVIVTAQRRLNGNDDPPKHHHYGAALPSQHP